MAVVGIDLGSLASKIGVARQRGVDIITNEVSNRATPSLVSFGPKQRSIGESAKTQEISNFKNTVGSLKRLVGRSVSDPEIAEIEKKFLHAELVDVNGTVGVNVNYLGERQTFSATQLLGMYFGKLRDTVAQEAKQNIQYVVIAVPGWFTDIQRRALLDAAAIANLNPLRLMNDTTAVALGYGITKTDLPEPENPRHVVFIDAGHSNFSVTIVAFSKGQLRVVSSTYDHHLGGRDLDTALVRYFAEEFKTKYKIDVLGNPKAIFRLAASCEKLKKVLSANAEAPLSVESIMNDVDASSKLSREQFEGLIAPILDRVTTPINAALAEAGLTPEQIDAIELVGGSTRVPAIKQRIQTCFPGKPLSVTLNQDEAIARGATFACAMLSPVFRVREFSTHDFQPYSIQTVWERFDGDPDQDTELVVFPRGNTIPSTKVLSFYRNSPFEVEVRYADPKSLPGTLNPWIGKFVAKEVKPAPDGEIPVVKIKARLNNHGIVSFEAAYTEEIEEREEAPMEVDGQAEAPPKKKKIVRKHDVPFVAGYTGLDSSILNAWKESEAQMHAADKLVMDTEDRKNALEEYVYDVRGKLDDRYAAFVESEEKARVLIALQEAENWLYTEEGEDATKSAYVTRLDALKVLGDPVTFRWREAEERPRALSQLRESINTFLSQATGGEERFSHIEEKDKQSVIELCATVSKWLDDRVARQAERPKTAPPVVTTEEIRKKREEVVLFSSPILNKPKPKPKVETPPPQSRSETPGAGEQAKQQQQPPPEEGAAQQPQEMDVD